MRKSLEILSPFNHTHPQLMSMHPPWQYLLKRLSFIDVSIIFFIPDIFLTSSFFSLSIFLFLSILQKLSICIATNFTNVDLRNLKVSHPYIWDAKCTPSCTLPAHSRHKSSHLTLCSPLINFRFQPTILIDYHLQVSNLVRF